MKRKVVIRLLNGLLKGCEFVLEEGRTLFLVADDKKIFSHHQSPTLPENTIFIPSGDSDSSDVINFEIIVSADAVNKLELTDEGGQETIFNANEIVQIGSLKLAWRNEDECFSDDILHVKEDALVAPVNEEKVEKRSRLRYRSWQGIVVLCLIGCVATIGYLFHTESQRQISSISELLNNDNEEYRIIPAGNKIYYVIATSSDSANRAAQALLRAPGTLQARVVTVSGEKQRIARWIKSHWPQVRLHRVRLDDPLNPVIEKSAERAKLSKDEQTKIIAALKIVIPYARTVSLADLQDKNVEKLAEQWIKKESVEYRKVVNKDSVTFVITGALDDGELERVKKLIKSYYEVWGGEYINYAVELKDDWLKGKTYKYGDRGYVKLSPGHWYFPGKIDKEI